MGMKKRWVENKKLVLAYFFLYETCQKQSFAVKETESLLVAGFSCWQHKDILGGEGGWERNTIVEMYYCLFPVRTGFFSSTAQYSGIFVFGMV